MVCLKHTKVKNRAPLSQGFQCLLSSASRYFCRSICLLQFVLDFERRQGSMIIAIPAIGGAGPACKYVAERDVTGCLILAEAALESYLSHWSRVLIQSRWILRFEVSHLAGYPGVLIKRLINVRLQALDAFTQIAVPALQILLGPGNNLTTIG